MIIRILFILAAFATACSSNKDDTAGTLPLDADAEADADADADAEEG